MEDYEKHLKAFDAYLVLKNYSIATRKSYGGLLNQFFEYRLDKGLVGSFSLNQARNYLLYRYSQGRKWQTINGDYSALQHFKHQVFMTLLYCTGLRLNEALRLRLADIDGERLQIHVVKGKGAKDRYVEMPVELLVLLREYYLAYRPKEYLFNGKDAGSLWSSRTAQWSIKRARKYARIIKQVSPHVFRHCYATHHLEEGTNLVYLKDQMGHKNIKTTARYIRLCKTYPKRVHHPIAGMKIEYKSGKR